MRLLVLILNKTEALEDILAKLADSGIRGATILSSAGMARTLSESQYENMSFLGSLRAVLDPDRQESKTVLMVIKSQQLETAISSIEDVIGSLDSPDTGIAFSLPIDFTKGINF